MATLKSVLHHFNKALKEYDTLHPETEVAQIVDLLPTINAAINGSSVTWDGKKFTNNALGITGLIDTNGYVAFGPNFGGLIIQWGTVPDGRWEFYFPIAFSSNISYGIGTTRSSGIGCFSFILRVKAADHIKWTDAGINGDQGQGDSYSFILIGY